MKCTRRIVGTGLAALVIALVALGEAAEAAPPLSTGVIEGTVSVHRRPPRRSAARYPGAAPRTRSVQEVPVVVFIRGVVAGVPTRTDGAVATLAQQDTAFSPAALAVQPGTVVEFPNGDSFFHNVFSYSGIARFDLGRYPRGESKEVRFDEPGIAKIYCEVHEFMRAVVVVTENPFHAVVGEDGVFRLEGVPAGTHTLVAWHPDFDEVEQRVVVQDGGTAVVDLELG